MIVTNDAVITIVVSSMSLFTASHITNLIIALNLQVYMMFDSISFYPVLSFHDKTSLKNI